MTYTCPVCRYAKLVDPPEDHEICPCCGTEFGEDDYDKTYEQLRTDWVLRGMPWFSRETRPPVGWNPRVQLGYTNSTLTTTALGGTPLTRKPLAPDELRVA